jgi:hypothetical protein
MAHQSDPDDAPGEMLRNSAIRTVRRILAAALGLGLVGTGAELLLLEHFEDWRQIVPIALIACALAVLIWHAVDRRALPVRVLQFLMLIFALSGVMGLVFHFRGNVEFERESYPSRAGLELFREAMMGATPALAPGTMIQLALIGLAYSYRHPRLSAHEEDV